MLVRRRRRLLGTALTVLLALGVALAGCAGEMSLPSDPAGSTVAGAVVASPSDTVLDAKGIVGSAASASRTFFDSAGIVVLSSLDDESRLRAASLAMILGVPALATTGRQDTQQETVAELERLGAHTVLLVGEAEAPALSPDVPMLRAVAAPSSTEALQVVVGTALEAPRVVVPGGEAAAIASLRPPFDQVLTYSDSEPGGEEDRSSLQDLPGLPPALPTERSSGVAVLTDVTTQEVLALGTARASGARVVVTSDGAVGGDVQTVSALGLIAPRVIVVIDVPGDPTTVLYQARVAASGQRTPGGGILPLPGHFYLATNVGPAVPDDGGGSSWVTTLAPSVVNATRAGKVGAVPAAVITTPRGDEPTQAELGDLVSLAEAGAEEGVMVLLEVAPATVEQLEQFSTVVDHANVGVVLTADARDGVPAALAETVEWVADRRATAALPPALVLVRDGGGAATDQEETLEEALAPTLEVAARRPEVALVRVVSGVGLVGEAPDGGVLDVDGEVRELWARSTAADPTGWWAWRQGAAAVPGTVLLGLEPAPVLIELAPR